MFENKSYDQDKEKVDRTTLYITLNWAQLHDQGK